MKRAEIRVRQADPAAEGALIREVLDRNLPGAGVPARFEWLYLQNPAGKARVWLAEDAATGEVVGTSAAHPKRFRVNGSIVTALNLSDFAVNAPYRSVGPALKLLKATLEPMKEGEYAFSYDHPSESMHALYRWMKGAAWSADMRRYVRLLRVTPALARRFGTGAVSRATGAAGDLALRARDRLLGAPDVSVSPLDGPAGEEFDRLDDRVASRARVMGARPASHVQWRYLDHAAFPHTLLCARRGGELCGYLAFRDHESEDAVVLADLHAEEDPGIARSLLAELTAQARARNADAIWAQTIDGSPAARFLEGLGFAGREARPGHVVYAPRTAFADAVQTKEHWWLLDGDRDV